MLKISKVFLRKLRKGINLSEFWQKSTNNALFILHVWMKKIIFWKVWENFRIFEKILKIIAKMHYFIIFFRKFNKACVNFLRVWTKKTISWKFWENFRKFCKKFLRKLRKCIIFAYFSKSLTNLALFFRVWTKNANCREIFWGKVYRKMNFLFLFINFFENFLVKI